MKLVLNRIEDLEKIFGRFILKLDHDNPIYLDEIKPELREFYFAKRIRFVLISPYSKGDEIVKIIETDLWGNSFQYEKEKYLNHFNSPSNGERFHRLLTRKELRVLFAWMEERNY